MRVFAQEKWQGPAKIIIGIDIGTTQSAISFSHMYPYGPLALFRVTHWPGQQVDELASKIPTLVYYNKNREAVAFGAEALKPEIIERAEEEGWELARHFKLRLHPKAMRQHHNLKVQPLPEGVSLKRIYTDFMIYLMQHTKTFFETHVVGGEKIWEELCSDMQIIIAHPNGWDVQERSFLREAAIDAKYTTKTKSLEQIRFVSEAEASIHFCVFNSDLQNKLEANGDLIVCDAGGSTIDTTAYCVKNLSPLIQLEEKKSSACVQAGAIFIDEECRNHLVSLLEKLELSREDYYDCLNHAVADFESSAKRLFKTVDSEYRIKLGQKLKKEELGIRRGTVYLTGENVRSFFDRCVAETIRTIKQQMEGFSPDHLLLVGGFGESPYLREVLLSEFKENNCEVTLANDATSKAVADGTVIWSARLSVTSRTTRMQYGTSIRIPHDPRNPTHAGRRLIEGSDGINRVDGAWSRLVNKDVAMAVAQKIHKSYWRTYRSLDQAIDVIEEDIYTLTAEDPPRKYWLMDKNGNVNSGFMRVCTIKGDLSEMRSSLKECTGPHGVYYKLNFDVVLMFGGTELQAFLEWKQNGDTKTTPVAIVPDAFVET